MSVTVEASQSVVMKEHMPESERLQLRKKRERKGRSGEEGEDRTQTYPGEQSKNHAAKDQSSQWLEPVHSI